MGGGGGDKKHIFLKLQSSHIEHIELNILLLRDFLPINRIQALTRPEYAKGNNKQRTTPEIKINDIPNTDTINTLLSLFQRTEFGSVIHVHAAELWEEAQLQWTFELRNGSQETAIKITLQQRKGSG